jgi:hypothetical protein
LTREVLSKGETTALTLPAISVSEEQAASIGTMVEKFKKYSPTFTGPGTPEEHIKAVLNVAYTHSVASGHGGAYLSHFGTRQWV